MANPLRAESTVYLPRRFQDPLFAVAKRFGAAILIVIFVAALVRLDNHGYRDSYNGTVSTLDAFYYATVSITTTGYGDIVPVTNQARLLTSSVVTVARVIFLILLVGTTVQVLTERGREAITQRRWRKKLKDHVIVCGYGTKGRSAVNALLAQGCKTSDIVVIDPNQAAIEEAISLGIAGVVGTATRTHVLEQAGITKARAVIVAPNDDASAVLTTLTARERNPRAVITSSVRESENAHLLRQGGANSVIVSSEAAGRLLGMSTDSPTLVGVLEDLITAGSGMEISERPVTRAEIGGVPQPAKDETVMAVVRNQKVYHPSEPEASSLKEGDMVVLLLKADS